MKGFKDESISGISQNNVTASGFNSIDEQNDKDSLEPILNS